MIVHIVSWRVIETEKSKAENILIMKKNIEELADKISFIRKIELGVNFTESEQANDIVLYSEFDSREDLERYQVHPEHQKVVEIAKEFLTNRVVVDYEK